MAKRAHATLVGFLASVLLAGCATTRGDDNAAIRALLDRFIAAVNAANTASFVACFAADATAFLPTNAARRVGIEAIREAVHPVFAQGPRTTPAHLGDLQISTQGELAVVSFDAGSGTMHSRRTLVLRKVDGQWRIVHLHASNVAEGS